MSDTDRFWLESMPPGIPDDIDTSAYASLWALARESVDKFPDLAAYHHLGTTISYQQLDALSKQFAANLQRRYAVSKGDRIALMVPNTLAHPIAMFGILRCGAIVVNINPLFTARELEAQLVDSEATVIVVMENFTHELDQVLDKTRIEHVIATRTGDFHSNIRAGLLNFYTRYIKGLKPAPGYDENLLMECTSINAEDFMEVALQPDDIAYLQYTGGTSGSTKAAVLSHGNIIANTLQAYACISPAFKNNHPYVITALPLYHIFALTANCFVVIRLAGCSHLITNPRDIARFISEIAKTRFNAITGVNTLFNAMLKHPSFKRVDFSALQLTLAGGMSVHKATAERWHEVTGSPIIEAYGLTEASPAITTNPVDSDHYSGTIGLPLPSTEVSIRDDEGNALPINSAGELWARGPQVMRSYWNRPEETREALTADGWLKTGDIAVMDEHGYITIVDRKKDMILVSGFNVYPSEVESVLCHHPEIHEAGVIGVTSEEHGEIVKAVIVRNKPTLSEQDIIEYCHQELAAYKVPKIIEFRDSLPKTNVGKILRRELR